MIKKIGLAILLAVIALFVLFSLTRAIPASAYSPIAPDPDPTDNYSEVWCPNECSLDTDVDKEGRIVYKLDCEDHPWEHKTIRGKPGETCWCMCVENSYGMIVPYCSCREFK